MTEKHHTLGSAVRSVWHGACAASLTLLFTSSVALADTPVELDYEVYFGGMHMLSARTEVLADAEDRYSISSSVNTRGWIDWLFGFRGEGTTEGSADGTLVQPERHARTSTWDDGHRDVKLTFADGGAVLFDVTESERDEDEDDEVTPLLPATLNGTMDPMSGIVMMSRRLQAGESCDGTLRLFDGERRYDVTLTETDPKIMKPSKYSVFSGEAIGCRVEFEKLGGFRKETSKYDDTARNRMIWVARPIEGGPPVPVQLTVQTGYGWLMVHLTRVRMGGVELALQDD